MSPLYLLQLMICFKPIFADIPFMKTGWVIGRKTIAPWSKKISFSPHPTNYRLFFCHVLHKFRSTHTYNPNITYTSSSTSYPYIIFPKTPLIQSHICNNIPFFNHSFIHWWQIDDKFGHKYILKWKISFSSYPVSWLSWLLPTLRKWKKYFEYLLLMPHRQ